MSEEQKPIPSTRVWEIGFYHPFPHVNVRFSVEADTMEQAKELALQVKGELRLNACFVDWQKTKNLRESRGLPPLTPQ